MAVLTPRAIANERERERAPSSWRTAVVRRSAPPPPYFSSYSTPSRPSAPMRGQMDFGIRPAASHASMWGATSRSTKLRTVWRNIACCSLKIFTAGSARRSVVAPAALHGVAVDAAFGGARQGLGEGDAAGTLEAGDLSADEVAHLLGGVAAGGAHLHDCLHALPPLCPGHPTYAPATPALPPPAAR